MSVFELKNESYAQQISKMMEEATLKQQAEKDKLLKQSLLERSEGKTGEVGDIIKSMNNFVSACDGFAEICSGRVKELVGKTVIPPSEELDENTVLGKELKTLGDQLNSVLTKYQGDVKKDVLKMTEIMKDSITEIISKPISEDTAKEIEWFKGMKDKLSILEVRTFLDRFYKGYRAQQLINEIIPIEEWKFYGLEPVLAPEELVDEINGLEADALSLVNAYDGFLGYNAISLLDGSSYMSIQDRYDAFKKKYSA